MAVSLNTGALVLYHGKFAAVTAINKEKIEIRVEGGASKSVRPKDVEFLFDRFVDRIKKSKEAKGNA